MKRDNTMGYSHDKRHPPRTKDVTVVWPFASTCHKEENNIWLNNFRVLLPSKTMK